ncbi:PQQ-binding-like beta-propeller repeat protein [Streptomyces sp. NPDC056002]|uniref:outer membrane protein assembly factor BamB family protein n=1 Tax=Streptomyces sp. NPDC056002 TaxID=3345675 RepID=UPI0035DA900A
MAGRILAGRYQLERLMGRGGMGEVWAAHDTVIRRHVAVKLLQSSEGDEGTDLFLREARTAGGLNHPGVVTIYDIGQDPDGTLYLVMELLQGRDLSAVLRHEGPPALADALDWAIQTVDALTVAHAAGIIHRDLKPANLMLTLSGTIKILDFGIARYASTATQASRIIGTPHYMPPERLLGKAGDGRGDLYSLGCLLHELLTGSTPFGDLDTVALMYAHLHRAPEPPSAARLDIPAALDQLVLDLLAKDPEDRPATADQVRSRLRNLATTPLLSNTPGTDFGETEYASGAPLPFLAQPVGTTHHDTAQERLQTPPPTALTVRALSPTRRLPAAAITPWTHEISDDFLSSPVVADGAVYIGGNHGRVYALNAATGTERWIRTTRGPINFGSLPTAVGGTVYIGDSYGSVFALDAATGTKQWTYSTYIRDEVFSSPVVVGGTVYIGTDERKVYALDAATGTEQWIQTTRGSIRAAPAVANGTVYVCSSDGRIYALDAITGTEQWTHRADVSESSSPAVADGTVYFGSDDGLFYALDAATGAERWTHPADASFDFSPTVADGTVYYGGSGHCLLYALDAATGAERWTTSSLSDSGEPKDDDDVVYCDEACPSPVVVEGNVYITSNDRKVLYALDAATGTKRWAHASSDGVLNTPAVSDGTVYISSERGKVYTLDAATGTGPAAGGTTS